MICSGPVKREGWKTLDCNPVHHPDFLAMIPPFPDEVKAIQWDEIEWIHGITSLHPWDAEQALRELHSILRPPDSQDMREHLKRHFLVYGSVTIPPIRAGGKLVLEQPDLMRCDPIEHPEWIFGDLSLRNPLHMNKWAYTERSLKAVLSTAGFSRVEILPAQHHLPERDFRAEAFR